MLAAVGSFRRRPRAPSSAPPRRAPVVLDGFIVGAAARPPPALSGPLIAGHRSSQPGHAVVLAALGLEPLLDLGLRLGEGSGAATSLGIVDAAVALQAGMATFDEAAVDDATPPGEAEPVGAATPPGEAAPVGEAAPIEASMPPPVVD